MPLPKIILVFFCLIVLINLGYVASQASISLSIDVYPKERIVSSGDEVLLQINLIQLLDQKRKDVVAAVSLISSEGREIVRSTETIALETKASFVSRLDIPENLNEGDYVINIEIFDANEKNLLGEVSKSIIIENKLTAENIYRMGVYLIAACLVIFIIMSYKNYRDFYKDRKKRITKEDIERYLRQEKD